MGGAQSSRHADLDYRIGLRICCSSTFDPDDLITEMTADDAKERENLTSDFQIVDQAGDAQFRCRQHH